MFSIKGNMTSLDASEFENGEYIKGVSATVENNQPSEKQKEEYEKSSFNKDPVPDTPNIDISEHQGKNNVVEISVISTGKNMQEASGQGSGGIEEINMDLTRYLKSVTILKLFEYTFKPIFKIVFEFPVGHVHWLSKLKNYKFHLTIETSEYMMNTVDKSIMDFRGSTKMNKALDIFLVPYILPKINFSKSQIDEFNKKDRRGDTSSLPVYEFPIECFIFDHIRTGHVLVSTNYRNQKLQNIIIDLINKNKSSCMPNVNHLVFCEPDNNEMIENLTLEPKPLYLALKQIQKDCHIYKRQSYFYVDADNKFYIGRRGFKPFFSDGYDNKITILIGQRVEQETSFISDYLNNVDESEKPRVFISEDEPFIEDVSASLSTKRGAKTIIKSDCSNGGINSMCLGFKEGTESNASTKYANDNSMIHDVYDGKEVYIKTNSTGPFAMELEIDKAQNEACFLSVTLKDVNVSLFNPTLNVLLKFADPDKRSYDGYYYIMNFYCLFTKQVETRKQFSDNMSSVVKLDLGRLFDDNGKLVV